MNINIPKLHDLYQLQICPYMYKTILYNYESLWHSMVLLLGRFIQNTQNFNMFFILFLASEDRSPYCLRYNCVLAWDCILNHMKDQRSSHSFRKKYEGILYIEVLVGRMLMTLMWIHINNSVIRQHNNTKRLLYGPILHWSVLCVCRHRSIMYSKLFVKFVRGAAYSFVH